MLFIEATREELLKPLLLLSGTVERKPVIPVFSNFLLKKNVKEVCFFGSDGVVQIETGANIGVGESIFEIALSLHKLIDILRSLPVGVTVCLSRKEGKVVLSAKKIRFSLCFLLDGNFPIFSVQEDFLFGFEIEQKNLLLMINSVFFAMAHLDARIFFNGMFFNIRGGNKLKAVASDGHRMACFEMDLKVPFVKKTGCTSIDEEEIPRDLEMIIPRKTALELKRILKNSEEKVSVFVCEGKVKFEFESAIVCSLLIDAKFPDYEKQLKLNHSKNAVVEWKVFSESLGRVSIFVSDLLKSVFVRFSKNMIVVESRNQDQEEAKEEIEAGYDGDPVDIGFNLDYLRDFFVNLEFESVSIHFSDSNSSVVFDVKEMGVKYILMPMRM